MGLVLWARPNVDKNLAGLAVHKRLGGNDTLTCNVLSEVVLYPNT